MAAHSRKTWLYAQFFLTWIGFLHVLKKLWPFSKRAGLEQFKSNYFKEGHLPVNSRLRAIAHESSRCTTCGLCDAACPENLSPMRALLQSPSQKWQGSCLDACTACEQACPELIPIIEYIKLSSKSFHLGKQSGS